VDPAALLENEQLAAQRAGAVWEACQRVMKTDNSSTSGASSFCNSNRLAMRREFTTYVQDCNETLQEFQDMIDAGPSLREEDEKEDDDELDDNDNDDQPSWEQFLGGGTDQYTMQEIPIATAALALIKCSRGCINVAMQACESVGNQVAHDASNDDDDVKLQWILRLFECAKSVGEGMTDLGAVMYPPIKVQELEEQVLPQSTRMEELLMCVFDKEQEESRTLQLGREVDSLATKVQAAVTKRKVEAIEIIGSTIGNGA
jgi:hypothetical protein